jgi:hypothetical protein
VVEPVLIAPLRRRWAEVSEQGEKLAERRDASTGGQATKLNNALSRLLSRFAEEIASVRDLPRLRLRELPERFYAATS